MMKKFGDTALGLIIDSCPKCWGIWFDAGEMKGFLQSDSLRRQFLTDLKVDTTGQAGGDRGCPRCRQSMDCPVVNTITVDVCRGCSGVWLDHGELNQLVLSHKKKGLRGDDLVVHQIREGLRTGEMSESLWERLKEAVRELLAKLFPD
jgi:Zn-finger nucleic acid-binding protein